jgi:multidrug efflux pump subunit AcrA (membrane-fusion protein)
MISAWTNHLWQSTVFALAAGLLTLAFRKHRANVRYWIWLCASFKFLLPFAVLMGLGNRMWQMGTLRHFATPIPQPALSLAVTRIAQPFSSVSFPDGVPVHPSPQSNQWMALAIIGVWACGVLGVLLIRVRGWLRIRRALRERKPVHIAVAVPVFSAPELLEPGVVGFFRPVLLLPESLLKNLMPSHLQAVLAHEMSHVRRRDNLTAAMHMIVEAIFWFYPLVWWIGSRLLEERERACDEAVLELGSEPHEYADAILKVCKSYMDSPLKCVAGIAGADLKKRVQAILAERRWADLNLARKSALIAAAVAALAIPVVVGMIGAPSIRAQSHPAPPIENESQSRAMPAPKQVDYLSTIGAVTATSVVVRPRIDGLLTSVSFKEGDTVQAGQVLASIDSHTFDVELAQAESQLAQDEAQLAWQRDAPGDGGKQRQATLAQFEGTVKADQAKLEAAKLMLSYAKVTAPITGVVGLRRVDPGNMVHATDTGGIVTINQIKPIAVIFDLNADSLPQVLARLNDGVVLSVEAWSRDDTTKLATGRLIAVDNQFNQETGTVKVKATFDNKDGTLFPNEFVNVRLLLKTH